MQIASVFPEKSSLLLENHTSPKPKYSSQKWECFARVLLPRCLVGAVVLWRSSAPHRHSSVRRRRARLGTRHPPNHQLWGPTELPPCWSARPWLQRFAREPQVSVANGFSSLPPLCLELLGHGHEGGGGGAAPCPLPFIHGPWQAQGWPRGDQCQPHTSRGSLGSAGAAPRRVPIPGQGTRAPQAMRSPCKRCLPGSVPPGSAFHQPCEGHGCGCRKPSGGSRAGASAIRGKPTICCSKCNDVS